MKPPAGHASSSRVLNRTVPCDTLRYKNTNWQLQDLISRSRYQIKHLAKFLCQILATLAGYHILMTLHFWWSLYKFMTEDIIKLYFAIFFNYDVDVKIKISQLTMHLNYLIWQSLWGCNLISSANLQKFVVTNSFECFANATAIAHYRGNYILKYTGLSHQSWNRCQSCVARIRINLTSDLVE